MGRWALLSCCLTGALATAGCSAIFSVEDNAANDGGNDPSDGGTSTDAGGDVIVGDFYISPTGNDSGDGSREDPFLTWSHALTQLQSGQTLVALDGQYPFDIHGPLRIDCGADGSCNGGPCQDGITAEQTITVAAENQRQAHLIGSTLVPDPVLEIADCQFWAVDGLRIQGTDVIDASGTSPEAIAFVKSVTGVQLRNLLLHDSNRLVDGSLLRVRDAQETLLEGLEFFRFHIKGLLMEQSNSVDLRLSYFNGRGIDFPDLANGEASREDCEMRGDDAVVIEGLVNSFVENVIIEETCGGVRVSPDNNDQAVDQQGIFGSMARNILGPGFSVKSECDRGCPVEGCTLTTCETTHQALRVLLGNNLAINADDGIDIAGAMSVVVRNFTSVNSGDGLDIQVGDDNNILLSPTVLVEDSIIIDSVDGFDISDAEGVQVSVAHTLFFSNQIDFNGSPSGLMTSDNLVADPMLGGCRAYLPAGSPLLTGGASDGPRGANILAQTRSGEEQAQPLWDSETGQFPCGVEVGDFGNNRCQNAHTRFGADQDACPQP